MITTAVIRIVLNTDNRLLADASLRICPFVYKMSSIAKMRILKRLLPRRLPTARSMEPIRTAARLTAISGREVETARKKVPTKDLPKPVNSAIWSAKYGSVNAETMMMSAKKTYRVMMNFKVIPSNPGLPEGV